MAIINDSDIWAVGQIYTTVDSIYNAAHRNGTSWNLKRIFFRTVCGQPGETAYPASAIIEFGPRDSWVSAGDRIAQRDGNTEKSIACLPVSFTVNKLWGRIADTVYAVGDGGQILRYYDGMWQQMSTGTTIDLRDIWGSSDGKTIWACGYSNDDSQSILLKYDGTRWNTVWSSNPSSPPYSGLITSLWGSDSLYLVGTDGGFQQSASGGTNADHLFSLANFPYRISRSASNNIVFVGDDAMIYHYNGAGWKLLNVTTLDEPLYSVAVSTNTIVAVGADYTVGFGAALIYMGTGR